MAVCLCVFVSVSIYLFLSLSLSLSLNVALPLERFVQLYDDNESGHPSADPPGATQWYWAQQHANSDAARACPSRRMAEWATLAGNKAFLYYWTYVPDAPGMCGRGACHCAELPFVFHVLSETPAELQADSQRNQMINASNPHEVNRRRRR